LFLLRHWHLAASLPFGEILGAFAFGLKFDMAVLSYLVLPFFIVSYLPLIGYEYSKLGRKILQPLFYFLTAIIILLGIIDIEYFAAFGDHLGVWFYTYLDQPGLFWYSVTTSAPIVKYVIAWILLAAVFIFGAIKIGRIFNVRKPSPLIARFAYFCLAAVFLAMSMRGSFSLAALDWGGAYRSNHYFANELSLNGTFTLSRSLYEYYNDVSRHDPAKYVFFPEREALKTVQQLVVSANDSLLEPGQSLKRLSKYDGFDSTKYNVVIIFLESWAARYVGALGGPPDITPFFDSLAQRSLLFKNSYASGMRTNRGLLSVLCSFPSLPGRTVMKLYGASLPFISLSQILGERGYQSYFIYGGDPGFDNMGGFFKKQGFNTLVGVQDFPADRQRSKWGIADHIVLAKANELFAQSKEPFLGVAVTLTNHDPFVLPDKRFEVFPESLKFHDYLNSFHYSDWSLGQYFSAAAKESYFKNSIFILVADHSRVMDQPDDIIGNYRIATLIYCPGRPDIKPREIETICGQVDLLPSLLDLLGGSAVQESWGLDLFTPSPQSAGFAFINNGSNFGLIRDSLLFYERVGISANLYLYRNGASDMVDISAKFPTEFKQMQHDGRAMLQLEVQMTHKLPEQKGIAQLARK
jgi:phosphoglycerol transferase MdoB-like AlkP superfamily enzyme